MNKHEIGVGIRCEEERKNKCDENFRSKEN